MSKYYIENDFGVIEEHFFENNDAAFDYMVARNKRNRENCKVYDTRGDAVYRVFDAR